MPIPVPIPSGPLSITEDDSATAELFVAAIGQVFANGTTGSSLQTKPTIIPTGPNSAPQIIQISSAEQQLFYRQLGIAILKSIAIAGGGGGTTTVDIGNKFTGVCPTDSTVGDLVYVSGPGKAVDLVDITDAAKIPTVGCIIEKASASVCTVQTHGLVSAIYSGLTPGRMYFAGVDSRPIEAPPVPGVGVSRFLQIIGVALDPTTLILSPSTTITLLNG